VVKVSCGWCVSECVLLLLLLLLLLYTKASLVSLIPPCGCFSHWHPRKNKNKNKQQQQNINRKKHKELISKIVDMDQPLDTFTTFLPS
jgi:hypothetical protein